MSTLTFRQYAWHAVATAAAALLLAAPAAAQSRGELLYTTHCIACHSAQVHWRDKKQVTDGPSLRAQVRQWQAAARLAWTDDDIEQVALYLDRRYYRLKTPARPIGQAPGPAVSALASPAAKAR